MLLIVEPLGQREARGVEGGKAAYQQMLDFTEDLKRAGVLMVTSSLATAATRLQRPQGAATRVLDGPFAETKELIAGYTLIQVRSRDEAIEWSRRYPNPTQHGSACEIEVRQLFENEDFAPDKP
jgi:hypothetical protein